ncbi:MAG: diaminopropionate ammonia-lyase, partial [Lachnospiraceae bacterium]|nr:diaminopropionate ammonia-lyase [Lachnospiraceae bacterium]
MRHWKNATVKAVIGRVNTCECEAVGDNKTEEQRTVFGRAEAEKARQFHQSFPEYAPTPLVSLDNLSELLGVKSIHVKDESYRFGLNAFKGLGGSYCIGNYVAQKLGMDIEELTYEYLISPEVKEKLGTITFITATDGNHGRGIAWTANRLGQGCVVLMPKGSASERLENIRALGAESWITDVNYDDTVRMAKELAEKNGWVLVQDTAWEGYEEIPTWIMQGYTTMGIEIAEQLAEIRPTHIFLQAGVGAMAGAMTGFFADYYDSKAIEN